MDFPISITPCNTENNADCFCNTGYVIYFHISASLRNTGFNVDFPISAIPCNIGYCVFYLNICLTVLAIVTEEKCKGKSILRKTTKA